MKKIIILTIVAAGLLLLLLYGHFNVNSSSPMEQKASIGIISAMDNEISVLLDEAKIEKVDTVGGVKYYIGKLCGKDVVITRAGIGKVRASSGVTIMLNRYNISKVLFTGIAGGVADDTKVLDEVVATRLVEHDYGIISNDGFVWVSGDPGTSREDGEYYFTAILPWLILHTRLRWKYWGKSMSLRGLLPQETSSLHLKLM